MSQQAFHDLMERCKDFFSTSDKVYKIKTLDEKVINEIFDDIESKCIGSLKISPFEIMERISDEVVYNNRYIKSYWLLFNKLYEKHKPKRINGISTIFDYFFYKERGVTLSGKHPNEFKIFEKQNLTLDVHEPYTIYRAIMEDNKELFIRFFNDDEFDINQKLKNEFYPPSKEGYSYLELCCYYGAVKCFRFLISEIDLKITETCRAFSFLGGNLDIIHHCFNELTTTPSLKCMEYAIISHNIDFITTFLMGNYKMEIPLKLCIAHENVQAYCVYFNETNRINDCFPYSPCFHYKPLCEYFLNKNTEIDVNSQAESFDGNTALHFAAWGNLKDIVELLLSKGALINKANNNGWTALHFTAYYNIECVANLLIKNNANVNAKDIIHAATPLHYAAYSNSQEIIKYLIESNADINARDQEGKTALHYAAINNSVETAELLVSSVDDINARDIFDRTALHYAAINNSMETAELLISSVDDINARDRFDRTALHYAAVNNSLETAKLLIESKADIDAKDQEGKTALHNAAIKNSVETAELLVSSVDDINARDIFDRTALHYAAVNNSLETAKLLIESKADKNARDQEDKTALHYAAVNNSLETAKLLIESKADKNARDQEGKTALQYAVEKGFAEIVNFLN